jgi:isopropylmalate/homocitrate/citramalate synthase
MGEWEKINNSPLNAMEEVRREMHLPPKVYLHDTTLRDGEQFPGVEFTKEDKIRIGKALSECGVHRIEIMPAVSPQDQEAAAELNSMGLSVDFFTKMAKAGVHVPPAQDIPTIIGRGRQVAVGKMSGRTSIEVKLGQLGLPTPGEEQVKEILERSRIAQSKSTTP